MTSSTRLAGRPWEWASHSRWLRAVRPGCSAAASSSEPTWLSGWRRPWYRWPPISALPSSGASSPRITRIVVDLPAPLGPTKPVTCPGWTQNVIPSSATVGPNLLRKPLTSIVASMPATVEKRGRCCRHAGEPSSPSLASEDNGYVDRAGGWRGGWAETLRRVAGAPHAPAVAVALLAVLAAAQAIAQPAINISLQGEELQIAFVLLALFTALPLGFLWPYPAAAALAVSAPCVLS